jgi:hypothetical protein
MARANAISEGIDYPVAAWLLLALLGLALPFIPVPGDHLTRIVVQFRRSEMAEPTRFTADTTTTICQVLAASMAYQNPVQGYYTRIGCGRRAAPDLAPGAAKVVGARGIEPLTPTMSR